VSQPFWFASSCLRPVGVEHVAHARADDPVQLAGLGAYPITSSPAALRWKVSKVLLIMQVSPLACGTPSDITVAGIRSGNIYRVEK